MMFKVHREKTITGRFRVNKALPVWRFQCEVIVSVAIDGREVEKYTTWRDARNDDIECAAFRSRHQIESATCDQALPA